MDPLNQLNVMRLQEPLPTALDLSMGCRQIPVRASSVEALDLVKKASRSDQSDRNSGTRSKKKVAAPESDVSRTFKQGAPDGSQLDPTSRFGYESRYCSVSLHNTNTLPLLSVLPAVALMPSPCPPIDPEDDRTSVEPDKVFTPPSRNPLERLMAAASQNVEADSGTPMRTRGTTRAGKSALNGLDSQSRYAKAVYGGENMAESPRTRSKSFLVPPGSASPTPSLHSISSVSVISEDSSVVERHSLVRKQTAVETLSSECTFSEANSPCSVEYISSDSDVVEVPVTNSTCEESPSHAEKITHERETLSPPGQKLNLSCDTGCRRAKRACRANALSFQEIAEILESSEVSSPALLQDSDAETDAFVAKNFQSTSDAEDADVLRPRQDGAPSSSSSPSKKATPSKRQRRSNSGPKKGIKGKKRAKPSPRSKAASGTAKRRRKKSQPSRSSTSMFSPEEPEIKLKYVNQANKEEKKEAKGDSFAPYIRMDLSTCTVVNFQEDDGVDARAKKGRQSSAASAASGIVPTTSYLQLGRLTSDDRTRAGQLCCLCGRMPNSIGLGDLHGPYYPSGYQPDSCQIAANHNSELPHSLEGSGHGLEVSEVEGPAERFREQISSDQWPGAPGSESGSDCRERWIHEDCSIWSAGVFLVKGKLYGLEEAVRLAQEIVCSGCDRAGATLGCFFKGCPNKYHFPCALQAGCLFNEENFTIRCPKHKNKSPRTSLSRLQNR
ncbi:uncharacterized protein [Salminus brasiliensis]